MYKHGYGSAYSYMADNDALCKIKCIFVNSDCSPATMHLKSGAALRSLVVDIII